MAEGPVSGRCIKRRTVHCAVTAIVVVVLNVVSITDANSFFGKDNAQAKQHQLAELKDVADKIASEVTDFFSPTMEQLENLDQKRLLDIFAGGDEAAMEAEAETLLEKFPTGLKIRLFTPGNYKLDREAKPPLGFASVSMLRSLEKSSNNIAAELHLANSPDKHIVVISKL